MRAHDHSYCSNGETAYAFVFWSHQPDWCLKNFNQITSWCRDQYGELEAKHWKLWINSDSTVLQITVVDAHDAALFKLRWC